jgi:hypothetical protein
LEFALPHLQAPFPVTNYLSTLWVKEAGAGNGCRIEYGLKALASGLAAKAR